MKILIALFFSVCFFQSADAQSLKKYPISNSGCSAYFFCEIFLFDVSYSEDSSAVYTGECSPDSTVYGLICVKLKEPVTEGPVAENLMISYLDYLKTVLKVKSVAGYGKGHTMEAKPGVNGVIDYWKDEKDNDWKIKGWTDGKFIVMMYVYEKGSLEYKPKHDLFLNGFRFPGM